MIGWVFKQKPRVLQARGATYVTTKTNKQDATNINEYRAKKKDSYRLLKVIPLYLNKFVSYENVSYYTSIQLL